MVVACVRVYVITQWLDGVRACLSEISKTKEV